MNRIIRINAMKRSGYHAITFWIMKSLGLPDNFKFAEHINEEKFIFVNYVYGEHRIGIKNNYKHFLKQKKTFESDINKKNFIYSHESKEIKEKESFLIQKKASLYYDILILRDPYNCLASRLKLNDKQRDIRKHLTDINEWKKMDISC